MNARIVKEGLEKISESVDFNYPAVGWYFSSENIENSFVFKKDKWVCMFMYIKLVVNTGKRIQFSEDHGKACGAAENFGFKDLTGEDGVFIAETERFKKDLGLAQQYYKESLEIIRPPKEKYLYMEKVESIDESREIEVINLFPDMKGLTNLTVLSGYDRERNMDNVLAPFASGCQSVFTVPYYEQTQKNPKSVIGLMDSLVRNFVPEDMISFSVPSNRVVEMANNIEGSFLDKNFENPAGF